MANLRNKRELSSSIVEEYFQALIAPDKETEKIVFLIMSMLSWTSSIESSLAVCNVKKHSQRNCHLRTNRKIDRSFVITPWMVDYLNFISCKSIIG